MIREKPQKNINNQKQAFAIQHYNCTFAPH